MFLGTLDNVGEYRLLEASSRSGWSDAIALINGWSKHDLRGEEMSLVLTNDNFRDHGGGGTLGVCPQRS